MINLVSIKGPGPGSGALAFLWAHVLEECCGLLCEAAYDLCKIAHDSVRKHRAGNAVRRHAARTSVNVDGRRSGVGSAVPVRVTDAVVRRHALLGHVLIPIRFI